MADRRKLQAEIDRCLKKVQEGVESFEDVWTKVQNATNLNQKEKYEADLKREIKKLQRLREQIKAWANSNDIKDKNVLVENRKLIEVQMERFKVVEKETKTKAYSKEGLGAGKRLDPLERERQEVEQWLQDSIEKLGIQVEKLETDAEALMLNAKKRKPADKNERVEAVKVQIERHRYHTKSLESLLRLLVNESVQVGQVKQIQDDVDYYIDSNQEPDFKENECIYDDFDLEDTEQFGGLLTENGENDVEGVNHLDGRSPMDFHAASNNHVGAAPATNTASVNGSLGGQARQGPARETQGKEQLEERRRHKSFTEDAAKNQPLSPWKGSTGSATQTSAPSSTATAAPLSTTTAAPLSTTTAAPLSTATAAPLSAATAAPLSTTTAELHVLSSSASGSSKLLGMPAKAAQHRNVDQVNSYPPSTLGGPLLAASSSVWATPAALLGSTSSGSTTLAPSLQLSYSGAASGTCNGSVSTPGAAQPSQTEGGGNTSPGILLRQTRSPFQLSSASTVNSGAPQRSLEPSMSALRRPLAVDSTENELENSAAIAMQPSPASLSRSSSVSSAVSAISLNALSSAPTAPATPPVTLSTVQTSTASSSLQQSQPQFNDFQPRSSNGPIAAGRAASPYSISSANMGPANLLSPRKRAAISEFSSNNGLADDRGAEIAVSPASIASNRPAAVVFHLAPMTASDNEAASKSMPPSSSTAGLLQQAAAASFGTVPLSETDAEVAQTCNTSSVRISPLLGLAPLGGQPLTREHMHQLKMLGFAHEHMPHPSDSERIRHYLPRNPCPTPMYYPQVQPLGADAVNFFQKLSTETLFYVFYYAEGTKAQYLAAQALKLQSWRFHTKFMTWFQRHDEPKIITDEFEQGTYIYFDYENWGQRRKESFMFEYRYLEDRDLS